MQQKLYTIDNQTVDVKVKTKTELSVFNYYHFSYCKGFFSQYLIDKITYVFFPTDVDECLQFPCQHGGLCRNLNGTYFCDCPTGWMGPHCQFGKVYSLNHTISNIQKNVNTSNQKNDFDHLLLDISPRRERVFTTTLLQQCRMCE